MYFSILSIVLILLVISIYYCIKFGLILIRIQDALSESLDVIDKNYNNVSKVLEMPVLYDSPEIRIILIQPI